MPRVRCAPEPGEWRPAPPGTIEGWEEITREEGGALLGRCGVCGGAQFVEVPAGSRFKPKTKSLRALARAGWCCSTPWGWVHRSCLADVRAAVAAGHVQLPLIADGGEDG